MWTCKKCHTENDEYSSSCKKCHQERKYPFQPFRFLLVTLALSGISIPGLVLAMQHGVLLYLGIIFLYLFLASFFTNSKPKYSGVISIVISVLLGIVAMVSYMELSFQKEFKAYESSIATISIITLLTSMAGIIIHIAFQIRKDNMERQKSHEKHKKIENQKRKEEAKIYGKPTQVIRPYGYDPHLPLVRVFAKSKTIEINSTKTKFENIIDYRVGEDVTSELHMSKPSMMRRGIIGGLLYGKIGAFAGVATADKYLKTDVDYIIYIRLKNGALRQVRTQDVVFLDKLCAALDSIIHQNNYTEEPAN